MSAGSLDEPPWSQRDQWILLGIFAVALLLRVAHFFQIQANDPFFTIPAVDGQVYQAQAEAIAGGDLAGEGVLILGPFYPFFMGLVYAVAGPSLFVLKQLQAALGAIDCLLVAALARLYFDRVTSLLAAGFAAVYGMLIFYGGTVMIVNVMVPLVLGSLILVTRALRAPSAIRWALAGLVMGAAVLTRQTMLLYAVVIAGWLVFALRESVSVAGRARMAGAFGLGVALLILPFTVRNYVVGDDFVLLNYANPDMVGHTGILDAAVKAVETIDRGLERICEAALARGGEVLITADHGNCEEMVDEAGQPHTAHTTNPVPLVWVTRDPHGRRLHSGGLADLAPTLLNLLDLAVPEEMTGRNLID